ncbi:MAG: NifU family protein [Phycisphaerae bacterium]|nr:NifU family protein [Phycisphaerae bacterium]
METRVKDVVEQFRVVTQAHGGDVEFVALRPDQMVEVRLKGACAGCPAATQTLKMGLEQLLRAQVPEIAGVENVG